MKGFYEGSDNSSLRMWDYDQRTVQRWFYCSMYHLRKTIYYRKAKGRRKMVDQRDTSAELKELMQRVKELVGMRVECLDGPMAEKKGTIIGAFLQPVTRKATFVVDFDDDHIFPLPIDNIHLDWDLYLKEDTDKQTMRQVSTFLTLLNYRWPLDNTGRSHNIALNMGEEYNGTLVVQIWTGENASKEVLFYMSEDNLDNPLAIMAEIEEVLREARTKNE